MKGKPQVPKLRQCADKNHYRSLDAAIPVRFTMSSWKKQKDYARSRGAKQP